MEDAYMKRERNPVVGGLVLLGLGLYFLFTQLFELPWLGNLGTYLLAGLGLLFLVGGVVRHEAGLMIPGGILTGLGIGVILTSGSYVPMDGGAVFMFAFAFGWLLITLFTAVFTEETMWWPLIPGAIMALLGGFLLAPDRFQGVMNLLSYLWPLFLVGLGLWVLFKAYRSKEVEAENPEAEDLLALEKKSS
jgi:hypothetical protein